MGNEVNKEIMKESSFPLNNVEIYELLFADSFQPIFILDGHTKVYQVNDAFVKLIGYHKEEFTFQTLIAEDDREIAKSSLMEALAGRDQIFATTILTRFKKKLEIKLNLIPIIKNEDVIGVFAIINDLTEVKLRQRELLKIEESLNHAQMIGNAGSWDYDVLENEAYWSNQMYAILGIEDRNNFIPTYEKFLEFVHPDDKETFIEVVNASIMFGTSLKIEFRIIREDKTERIINEQASAILDENGNTVRLIGTCHDVTDQRETEKQLLETEKQFRDIYNNLQVGIWSFDYQKNKVIFCSKGMEKISGYPAVRFEENHHFWFELVHPDDQLEITRWKKGVLAGENHHYQYRIINSFGETRWVIQQTISVFDANQKLVRIDGIITDITEQRKAEETISHIASHDYLTNLSNRLMFDQCLSKQLKQSKKHNETFALLYLDIDRFKNINDTLGHFIGDELIRQISLRLRNVVNGECLFRIRGDEFALILANIEDDHYPIEIAEKIKQALTPPFDLKGYEANMTTSIGISLFPQSGEDEESLLKAATNALTRAKSLGKNNIQVHNNITNDEAYKRYSLEQDMRKAIDKNQFEVYYQPRVCAVTGDILCAEALIRWNHPEWGLVHPGDFITLAEEIGFIHEIGKFVLKTVCQKINEWKDRQLSVIPISINISARSFFINDLVSTIVSTINGANVNGNLIELEITESSFLENMDKVVDVVNELKKYGIKVALDDFGTGYSSLTHLKSLNIDTIKIDRSFIQNIIASKEDEAITSCIIELALGLNMDVVAEGVETIEQLELLRKKGCNQIQGYYFSRPVPEKEFVTFLEKGFFEVKSML